MTDEISHFKAPTTDAADAWMAYWQALGQQWRREPEIGDERKRYLLTRLRVAANPRNTNFPFSNIRLHRSDIEWLLARAGDQEYVDLRGADVRDVDLSGLERLNVQVDEVTPRDFSPMPNTNLKKAHIFVSHSGQDVAWCRGLVSELRKVGADVWYDEYDLGQGRLRHVISDQLVDRRIFILVLSPSAVRSGWVHDEMDAAMEMQRRNPEWIILPVVAEECSIPVFWCRYKRVSGPNDTGVSPEEAASQVLRILANSGITYPLLPETDREQRIHLGAQGMLLFVTHHYDAALAIFDRLLAIDPMDAGTWSQKGFCLDMMGRREEALASFRKSTALEPDSAACWDMSGMLLVQLDRPVEAIDAYERALALESENASAWEGLGEALCRLERVREGVDALDHALELKSSNASAWSLKGAALLRLGHLEDAISACDEAIAINAKNVLAWHTKGAALGKLDRPREALCAFEEALVLDPDSAECWHDKGTALRVLGQFEDAVLAYEHSLRLNPKFAHARIGLAYAFAMLGRSDESIAVFDQALALEPYSSILWDEKIALLHKLGRHLEAESIRVTREAPFGDF